VYLLCSDGLTTMISEEEIAATLRAHPRLPEAGEALIAAANEAGGRDNVTVVLVRLEEFELAGTPADVYDTGVMPEAPAAPEQPQSLPEPQQAPTTVSRRTPRRPRAASAPRSGRARPRIPHAGALVFTLLVLGMLAAAGYLAFQNVYFIATNNRGLVTMYEGLPYKLPAGLQLYSSVYVSGVSAATLTGEERRKLLSHSLRSEADAGELIRSIELEQLE
jgi:hypothetical protein